MLLCSLRFPPLTAARATFSSCVRREEIGCERSSSVNGMLDAGRMPANRRQGCLRSRNSPIHITSRIKLRAGAESMGKIKSFDGDEFDAYLALPAGGYGPGIVV